MKGYFLHVYKDSPRFMFSVTCKTYLMILEVFSNLGEFSDLFTRTLI